MRYAKVDKVSWDAWIWAVLALGSIAFIAAASWLGVPRLHEIVARTVTRTAPTATHVFWVTVVLAGLVIFLLWAITDFGESSGSAQGKVKGIAGVLIGKDLRLSTSKLQVAIWTWFVALALLFLVGLKAAAVIFGPHRFDLTAFAFPEGYLILLGGPFAAYVIARASTESGVAAGSRQKTDGALDRIRPAQAAQNDDGTTSLVDLQYLVFNLVLLAYFIVSFVKLPTALPEIPGTLLALTGVSALTYAGAKSAFKNEPVIKAVLPEVDAQGRVSAGKAIEIRGDNLVPPGSDTADPTKWLVRLTCRGYDGTVAADQISQPDGSILVDLPDAVVGDTRISVLTSAGVWTASADMVVYP